MEVRSKEPLVTIITPVFNAGTLVIDTINAVLAQEYRNYEWIIVDDCGTDDSMKYIYDAYDSRMRIIQNETNCGIAKSRNKAIEMARGKYIAILDDDDIPTKDRLKLQVEFLESHPSIDAVGGQSKWIDEKGTVVRDILKMPENPLYIKASFLFENIYNNSEVLFKRETVIKHGIRYKEGMFGMEDFAFWIEFSKVGWFSNINHLVLFRRMIGDNYTSKMINTRWNERKKKYRELQQYSLNLSGYSILEKDFLIINNVINEEAVRLIEPDMMMEYCQAAKKLIMDSNSAVYRDELKTYLEDKLFRLM